MKWEIDIIIKEGEPNSMIQFGLWRKKYKQWPESYWRGTEYNHYDDIHNHKILRGEFMCEIWAGRKKKASKGREALERFAVDETI